MFNMTDYSIGDIYPNLSSFTTRTRSIPEPDDQLSLVDNQELAKQNPITVSDKQNFSIWTSLIIVVAIAFLLSMRV